MALSFLTSLLLALGDTPSMTPDRPDLSNGTAIVEPGGVQLELGHETVAESGQPATPSLITSLRVGVHERIEIRLAEGDVMGWTTTEPGRDAEPTFAFGAKLRVLDSLGEFAPSIGLQPMVSSRVPGGALRGTPPAVAMLWIVGQPLGDRLALDLNLLTTVELDRRRDPLTLLGSASLGFDAHERILLFVELFGGAEHDRERLLFGADAGIIGKVMPRLAVDAAFRYEDGSTRAYVVVVGCTVLLARVGHFMRRRTSARPN